MGESRNTPSNQFYEMLNEPLPPTPTLKYPSNSPQLLSGYQQTSLSQTSPTLTNQQSSDIVGPSDHYGAVHHQYGDTSATTNNNTSMRYDKYSAKPLIASSSQQNQEETKVCVTVDSRTPVIFKIPLPPNKITLGDLKRALPAINQPNYKYFFKSNDSEFGIVKEEVQDDHSKLSTYRNRVVVWIVTPGRLGEELTSKTKSETDTCNLTYSNTSYGDGSSSLMTTDMETTSYYTETDDDSVSCSNYSETTCDTFISQRKNGHYKHMVNSPSHHHRHDYQQKNSPYHHNGRNDRSRNIDISPSTSPTSSSSSLSDATAVHCVTVHLVLTDKNFLGLKIYANAVNGIDEGIYVGGVTKNSAVALDGRIERGDKLIQVNEVNLEELTNEEALSILKEAVIRRGPLKLVVAKFVDNNKNDNTDGIISPVDAIHPIDTAAWVAHAQAITIPNIQDQANSATSSPSFGSNAQDTDFIRPASAGMARLSSGLRLNRGTTDIKDIILHMKMPNIGLDIRDREWLKIQIPKAFLGNELVTWLGRNVCGFNNSREAKKFASRMLKEGYIRDPICKKSFSSKSYYTFVV